ncbi:ATP synthase F0 subunit B [Telmatobacter bradus]|uniref:ATP synthase F0 subunit B n=1 Tax=Telmatobacter bradus TaxID=474953 RepID=UPI003B434E0B
MSLIIQQIEALLLGAIPTMILFIVLVLAYQFLVHTPLTATLKKRHELTEGAMEEAQKAIARAEARTSEYAEKLRLARAEAFKVREQRVKQWSSERDVALDAARKAATEKLVKAKVEIASEATVARQAIEASAADLAAQVVRAVLPATGGAR